MGGEDAFGEDEVNVIFVRETHVLEDGAVDEFHFALADGELVLEDVERSPVGGEVRSRLVQKKESVLGRVPVTGRCSLNHDGAGGVDVPESGTMTSDLHMRIVWTMA